MEQIIQTYTIFMSIGLIIIILCSLMHIKTKNIGYMYLGLFNYTIYALALTASTLHIIYT